MRAARGVKEPPTEETLHDLWTWRKAVGEPLARQHLKARDGEEIAEVDGRPCVEVCWSMLPCS